MQIIINLPDDMADARALLDAYENRNAGSKATDISEPAISIAQDEDVVQDCETDSNNLFLSDEIHLDFLMGKYGLSFTENPNGGSASANKIGCKKHILDNLDKLGFPALDKTFQTLISAYPNGGEKWAWKIVKDVWTFYKCCEVSDFSVDTRKCASLLSECPHSHREYTLREFADTITEIPGEATLRRYAKGFHGNNRPPLRILHCMEGE